MYAFGRIGIEEHSQLNIERLAPIIDAMEQAVHLTSTVQEKYLVRHEKAGHEPVTIGDYGAQAILCRALQQHFPDDAVVAEESGKQFLDVVSAEQRALIVALVSEVLGLSVTEAQLVEWLNFGQDRDAARAWVIDPIDGTKGFLRQERYAIACGLVEGQRAIAGLMACPNYPTEDNKGLLFMAGDGQALARPMAGGAAEALRVSSRVEGAGLLTAESMEDSHVDRAILQHVYDKLGISAEARRSDGMGKYGMVARGEVDLYMRIPKQHGRKAKIWDHVAGVAVLEAAGGKVTDKDGKALNFLERPTLDSSIFVIATNGHIHDAVIAALQEVEIVL